MGSCSQDGRLGIFSVFTPLERHQDTGRCLKSALCWGRASIFRLPWPCWPHEDSGLQNSLLSPVLAVRQVGEGLLHYQVSGPLQTVPFKHLLAKATPILWFFFNRIYAKKWAPFKGTCFFQALSSKWGKVGGNVPRLGKHHHARTEFLICWELVVWLAVWFLRLNKLLTCSHWREAPGSTDG